MQANPSGGWSRAEPHKWADICSDGEADTSSECCQSASEKLSLLWIENDQLWKQKRALPVDEHDQIEELKKQIRENSDKVRNLGGYLQKQEPPLPSRQPRSREFKAKKGGGLEVVEAKGKKNKGGKGQQRVR